MDFLKASDERTDRKKLVELVGYVEGSVVHCIPDDGSSEQISVVGEWSDGRFTEQQIRQNDCREAHQHA